MLVCRQPTRRLLIARVAIICFSRDDSAGRACTVAATRPASTRFSRPTWCPTSLIDELEKDPNFDPGFDRARAPTFTRSSPHDFHDIAARTGPMVAPQLDFDRLVRVWGQASPGFCSGFWGVRWLIRHSLAPSPATAEIFERLLEEGLHATVPAGVAGHVASASSGDRRAACTQRS